MRAAPQGSRGVGIFVLPDVTIFAGNNVFKATAFDTEGHSANAELILIGSTVPEPETMALLLAGLATCGVAAGRRSARQLRG